MHTFIKIITIALLLIGVQTYHASAKRLALVIGNDTYHNLGADDQLERAKNDAHAVSQSLHQLGFKVINGFDLGRTAMNRKIADISDQITPGDEVVFFFAGHGVAVKGQNYLLPSDVPDTQRETLLKSEAILVSNISQTFTEKGARISLLILDACRNNPFTDKKGRSIGGRRGLAGIDAPGSGTMVLFSAGAGQEALDSLSKVPDNHKNSVFTRTLIPLMETKGLEIHRLAREVRKQVHALAKQDHHTQIPASYDEIIEDYYLAGPGKGKKKGNQKVALSNLPKLKPFDHHVEPDTSPEPQHKPEPKSWIETLSGECKTHYGRWKKLASVGAFAVSETGTCGWSWGVKSATQARNIAINSCRQISTGCRIVKVHTNQPGDWTLGGICKGHLRKWQRMRGRKAFAVARGGQCGWSSGNSSISAARRTAIRSCHKSGIQCRIYRQR